MSNVPTVGTVMAAATPTTIRNRMLTSRSGTPRAAGAWCLVCLAFNLKRFHTLSDA